MDRSISEKATSCLFRNGTFQNFSISVVIGPDKRNINYSKMCLFRLFSFIITQRQFVVHFIETSLKLYLNSILKTTYRSLNVKGQFPDPVPHFLKWLEVGKKIYILMQLSISKQDGSLLTNFTRYMKI